MIHQLIKKKITFSKNLHYTDIYELYTKHTTFDYNLTDYEVLS